MIAIKSSEEFNRLLKALAEDVGTANIHWQLYLDLHRELGRHPIVWQQSQTFWHLTLNAHSREAVQALSRAYDQDPRALHLLGLLKAIEENLHLFSTEEFKKRLAGNPFVDSLAASPRTPSAEQLAADIASCSASDPKVRSLIQHRSNIGAHRNAKAAALGTPQSRFGISTEDFEALLERAHMILNRYSSLFAASTYSRKMVGHDDHRFIFQSVINEVSRLRRG